jgi:ABC-2 type transport system permease protein
MTGLFRLTLMELKLFLREPLAVFLTVAFPALLVGILGSVPVFRAPDPSIGGQRVIDLYVPIVVAFILVMVALSVAPNVLATYRERGILRRLATTPVRPVTLLAAQLAMGLVTAVVAALVVLGVGRLAFGVPLPRQPFGYALAFLLSAAAVYAMGLLLAAVAPNGRGAQGLGAILVFPVLFFAGLWIPRAVMPDVLRHISDFTPLGAGVQALQDTTGGAWPQPLQLAVMAAYVVVFGLLAARTFRWQ